MNVGGNPNLAAAAVAKMAAMNQRGYQSTAGRSYAPDESEQKEVNTEQIQVRVRALLPTAR